MYQGRIDRSDTVPSNYERTKYLDVSNLGEDTNKLYNKFNHDQFDGTKTLDKSDFLSRMPNFDRYQNTSDLDNLLVYEMKRTLVESVIEEQYAMDNTNGKWARQSGRPSEELWQSTDRNQRSVHMALSSPSHKNIQTNSTVPQHGSPVEYFRQTHSVRSSSSRTTESQRFGSDNTVSYSAQNTILLSGGSDTSSPLQQRALPCENWNYSPGGGRGSHNDIQGSSVHRVTPLSNLGDTQQSSPSWSIKSSPGSNRGSRDSSRDRQGKELLGSQVAFGLTAAPKSLSSVGFRGSPIGVVSIHGVAQPVSSSELKIGDCSALRQPGQSDSLSSGVNHIGSIERNSSMQDMVTGHHTQLSSTNERRDPDPSYSSDNEDVFIDVDDSGVPDKRTDELKTNPRDNLSAVPEISLKDIDPTQRDKGAVSSEVTTQHIEPVDSKDEQNPPLFHNLSPEKRRSQEPLRRIRGRRKSHVPLQRKKTFRDFNASSVQPCTLYAEHFQASIDPSGGQFLNPFVHPTNYLYHYPGYLGVQEPAVSMPMPSLPQMVAYPLPQVSLPKLSTQNLKKNLGNASSDSKRKYTDQEITGLKATRPPFMSQQFDTNYSQYDPGFYNNLFQQWPAVDQNQALHPAQAASATVGMQVAPKPADTKSKDEADAIPSKASSDISRPLTRPSNRTEINSNEELTQYFNLLFNPSGYKPKEKSCRGPKAKTVDTEQSECLKANSGMSKSSSINRHRVVTQTVSEVQENRRSKVISIDLTEDDKTDLVIGDTTEEVKKPQSLSSTKRGVLPISVTDELWSMSDISVNPEMTELDLVDAASANTDIIAEKTPEAKNDTKDDGPVKKPESDKPYVPNFFQNLPEDAFNRVELLESIKKWTVSDQGELGQDQGELGQDQGELGQDQGELGQDQGQKDEGHFGQVQAERSGAGQYQTESARESWCQSPESHSHKKPDTSVEGKTDEKNKQNINDSERKIPVLDAMETIITGLLHQGAVDLSLATKSVNQLFEDKLNGISTPCTCNYRRRPAKMSRSMVAHANALNRAKQKQAQAAATFRKSTQTMQLPVRSVQRAETVFPEMIQEKQVMKRPMVQPNFKPSLPPKKSKLQSRSSTIRHYGPLQMSDCEGKATVAELSKSDKIVVGERSNTNCHSKSKLSNLCQNFQPSYVSKAQYPFLLNEYPPYSLIPNAHKLYSDYLAQKRSLEMLQSHFCMPLPVPMKRPRMVFVEEGKKLNGPAMCSV